MTLRYSQQKIAAALQLISEFKAMRFPHSDSASAVNKLELLLRLTKNQFDFPSASIDLTRQTEMETTALIDEILGLLGIISNSANVRNSFEIQGPVLDLAKRLLGDEKANLIISFEWKYIPFTYPQNHPHLPSFVVIGMPASEASNALLLPVTGHELGHSLWRRDRCHDHFEPEINEAVIQSIKKPLREKYDDQFKIFSISADNCDDYQNLWTWEKAADYCFRQVEEIFSDFVGLSLFGTSYLDSFEYLLSPALSTERDPEYPADATRAQYLEDNAARVGVTISGSYKTRFAAQNSPFHPERNQNFQMILADCASETLVTPVADHVARLCANRGVSPPDAQETEDILCNFLSGVPAEHTTGLGAILNAGWSAFKDPNFMAGDLDQDRIKTINELVLKSIEVHEIERITYHGSKKKRSQKGT